MVSGFVPSCCGGIRNNHPDYSDYDEVLFAIGYHIMQLVTTTDNERKKLGYQERTLVFLQDVVKRFPRSGFALHSWMAMAELHLYERRDTKQALRAFEKVLEWGAEHNPHYAIALYYKGWCLLGTKKKRKKAIRWFDRAIEFSVAHPERAEARALAERARLDRSHLR